MEQVNSAEPHEVSVKPKRRIVRNPRVILNENNIRGPKGICLLKNLLKQIRFRGKNHEASDLRLIMITMEYWAHRLMPNMKFEDFIEKCEFLGSKSSVKTYVNKIRLGMINEDDYQVNEENYENNDDVSSESLLDNEEPLDILQTAEEKFDSLFK